MFRSYLKIAFRNMFKHKSYSFINIIGLAIGMTYFMIIMFWVQNELSYDKFHENADNIYRLTWKTDNDEKFGVITPAPLAGVLKDEFPEIVNSTRYTKFPHAALFKYKENKFQTEASFADPGFLKMFTFPFIKGDPETALNEPLSIICTEDMANQYFHEEDPLGKVITFQFSDNQEFDLKVTGIIKNIPNNSHIQTSAIIPFDFWKNIRNLNYWGDYFTHTYLSVQEGSQIKNIETKIGKCMRNHMDEGGLVFLQSIKDIHLFSDFKWDSSNHSDIKYVQLFSVIALFILLIACINFMNLSTAHSLTRSKEIGLRKVVGANRNKIILQFLGESFCYLMLSVIIAIFLTEISLPVFNDWFGKKLTIDYLSGQFVLVVTAVLFLTTIISAGYPSFFLSSFNSVKSLNNKNLSSGGNTFRKSLVAIQFSLSIMIIIGSIVVSNQLNYMRNASLGYNSDNLIYVKMSSKMSDMYQPVKSDLLQNPDVINVTANELGVSQGTNSIEWIGKHGNDIYMRVHRVDYDFLITYDIKMVEGRFFSKEFLTDVTKSYVVNEAAVKAMGMNSPVGKQFQLWARRGIIIGVIKDFNFKSLHDNIEPLILWMNTEKNFGGFRYLTIRINSKNIPSTLSFIESVWKEHDPNYPLEYKFIDVELDAQYRSEQRIAKIFNWFTFLGIFISCMGLFGMVSFMVAQKTKEIGVRKVLGASVTNVVVILLKDFLLWILLANLIAWPIAYFFMNKWLQDFAYRVDIEWWVFIAAGAIALLIALATISFQAIKAATANPVKSLKYE